MKTRAELEITAKVQQFALDALKGVNALQADTAAAAFAEIATSLQAEELKKLRHHELSNQEIDQLKMLLGKERFSDLFPTKA